MFKLFQRIISRRSCGGVFTLLHRRLHTRKPDKGGILIECTFSIPVCIFLLLFVNDHYRFYELKSKVRTSTYLAASMIQHVTNKRTDKRLTKKDIARITHASGLNFFHTNAMYDPWPFGIYYLIDCFYVKRINSNSYQFQEIWGSTVSARTPNDMGRAASVTTRTLAQVQAMCPDLVCDKDGDERLIVEAIYRNRNFNKSKLGFFLLEPKNNTQGTDGNNALFLYKLVIVPKPGLFPVTE